MANLRAPRSAVLIRSLCSHRFRLVGATHKVLAVGTIATHLRIPMMSSTHSVIGGMSRRSHITRRICERLTASMVSDRP